MLGQFASVLSLYTNRTQNFKLLLRLRQEESSNRVHIFFLVYYIVNISIITKNDKTIIVICPFQIQCAPNFCTLQCYTTHCTGFVILRSYFLRISSTRIHTMPITGWLVWRAKRRATRNFVDFCRPRFFVADKKMDMKGKEIDNIYLTNSISIYRPFIDLIIELIIIKLMLYNLKIGAEALACRNAAAMFNMSYYGKLYLTGPDAQRTAELAFTADLSKDNNRLVEYVLSINKMAAERRHVAFKWCKFCCRISKLN